MTGFPGWQAIMRSCPSHEARGEMLLVANAYAVLEQGSQDYVDISIVPFSELPITGLDCEVVAIDEFGEFVSEN